MVGELMWRQKQIFGNGALGNQTREGIRRTEARDNGAKEEIDKDTIPPKDTASSVSLVLIHEK